MGRGRPRVPPQLDRRGRGSELGAGSERVNFCKTRRGVLHCGRARHRRRVWPRGLGPRHLPERRGPFGGHPGQIGQGLPPPQGMGRPLHRWIRLRPGRPGKGGRARGRRVGRSHQRGQHEHPHRPHRPGELQDPQRGGPHLRPPAGRDLPATRDPHRGHRHVDHRPGAAALVARRGRPRLVRPHRAR